MFLLAAHRCVLRTALDVRQWLHDLFVLAVRKSCSHAGDTECDLLRSQMMTGPTLYAAFTRSISLENGIVRIIPSGLAPTGRL